MSRTGAVPTPRWLVAGILAAASLLGFGLPARAYDVTISLPTIGPLNGTAGDDHFTINPGGSVIVVAVNPGDNGINPNGGTDVVRNTGLIRSTSSLTGLSNAANGISIFAPVTANVDFTLENSGTIQGSGDGGFAGNGLSGYTLGLSAVCRVTNSGTIQGSAVNAGGNAANGISWFSMDSTSDFTLNNSGTISGTAAMVGTGFSANGVSWYALGLSSNCTVVNSGTIQGSADVASGFAANGFSSYAPILGGSVMINNSGTISGSSTTVASGFCSNGVSIYGGASTLCTVTNSGTMSGSGLGNSAGFCANGLCLYQAGPGSAVTNTGRMSGSALGFAAGFCGNGASIYGVGGDLMVNNSGTMEGRSELGSGQCGNGLVVFGAGPGSMVINSGTLRGSTGNGSGRECGNGLDFGQSGGSILNTGLISGSATSNLDPTCGNGITLTPALPATVRSENGITFLPAQPTIISNGPSGRIVGTNMGVAASRGVPNAAPFAPPVGVAPIIMFNSGAVEGGSGTAVLFGGGDDSLTLLSGARVFGLMDGGAHVTGDALAVRLSGVNAAKRAEIQALFNTLGASGGAGSFTLHGDTFSFTRFENLILDTSSYEAQGLSHNQQAIGHYLDNLSWFSGDLTRVFGGLDASGNVAQALNQLSPELYDIYPEIAYRNALYAGAALDRRLSFLRGVGMPGGDFAGLFSAPAAELADNGGNAGLKTADKYTKRAPEGQRWGAWATGFGGFADKDSDTDVTGYHAQTGAALIGADYRVDRNFYVGLSGGYAYTHADLDHQNSAARADSFTLGAYATYHNSDGLYVDGAVNGGWDDYATRRNVALWGFDEVARSDHDGTHVDARLGAGWMKNVGAGFTLGPTFALQYVHLGQSAIRETGAGDVSLRIDDRDTDSLASLLGFRAAARFTADGGRVEWNPELRARWVHEYLDGNRDLTARFFRDTTGSFTVRTDRPIGDSGLIGVGVSATVDKRFTGYLQYDADLGRRDGVSHSVGAGFRVKF